MSPIKLTWRISVEPLCLFTAHHRSLGFYFCCYYHCSESRARVEGWREEAAQPGGAGHCVRSVEHMMSDTVSHDRKFHTITLNTCVNSCGRGFIGILENFISFHSTAAFTLPVNKIKATWKKKITCAFTCVRVCVYCRLSCTLIFCCCCHYCCIVLCCLMFYVAWLKMEINSGYNLAYLHIYKLINMHCPF